MSLRDIMVAAGLFMVACLLQFYLSYLQVKHITRQYLELTDKYKKECFIGVNRRKRIDYSPVVILVTGHRNVIQEFYILDGLLVTARMRHVNLEEEVGIAELERHKNYLKGKIGEKGFRTLQNVTENIMNYC